MHPENPKNPTNPPLIVDLDHTLIDTDLLYQSALGTLKKNPLLIVRFPFWLWRGKGYLKHQLVARCPIDVRTLPYNVLVLDYLKMRKKQGAQIVLATASHQHYATAVAQYLGLFDAVMASDETFNLSSHFKAQKLIERFGNKQFDYMGDHRRDLPVWEASNLSILVNVSAKIIQKTQHLNTLILSKK